MVDNLVETWRYSGAICARDFPKNLMPTEMDVKTVNVIVKNNSQQFSMVNTLIDHRNDVKMFKTLHWSNSPVVRGSTWVLNIQMSFLWSIIVHTMENCCRFVNLWLCIKLPNWKKSVCAVTYIYITLEVRISSVCPTVEHIRKIFTWFSTAQNI